MEQVLPEALVVKVKRTSDPNLVPKGRTQVAREIVRALETKRHHGGGRRSVEVARRA